MQYGWNYGVGFKMSDQWMCDGNLLITVKRTQYRIYQGGGGG
jgi:hypothetical protein